MKKIGLLVGMLNLVLGIALICNFLYNAGHYYIFEFGYLYLGIWCLFCSRLTLKQ